MALAVFTIERDVSFDDDEWFSVGDGSGADERVLCGSHDAAVMHVKTHAAPIADAIERAILAALAEQAAGEAERVREAVARAYEDAAQVADRYGHAHIADAIRARATSPAPWLCVAPGHPRCSASAPCSWCLDAGTSPAPAPVGAERAVIEAAVAWHATDGIRAWTAAAVLRGACDALAAARKGG